MIRIIVTLVLLALAAPAIANTPVFLGVAASNRPVAEEGGSSEPSDIVSFSSVGNTISSTAQTRLKTYDSTQFLAVQDTTQGLGMWQWNGSTISLVGSKRNTEVGTSAATACALTKTGTDNTAALLDGSTLQAMNFDGSSWTADAGVKTITPAFSGNYNDCDYLQEGEIVTIGGTSLSTFHMITWTYDGVNFSSSANDLSISGSGYASVCAHNANLVSILIEHASTDRIMRFARSGGVWTQEGSSYSTAAYSGSHHISCLGDNQVIYHTSNTSGDIQALKWNGSTYAAVGTAYDVTTSYGSWPRSITVLDDSNTVLWHSYTGANINALDINF